MKRSRGHKIAMTLIVTVILVVYFTCYGYVFFKAGGEIPPILGILFFLIPVVIAVACVIYVSIERIKEIEKGEEDA